jgi:hypothetical protein
MAGKILLLLAVLSAPCFAQDYVVTYDSRVQSAPDYPRTGLIAVDVAVRDWRNPDFDERLLTAQTPALLDAHTYVGVTITGTLDQAKADLVALSSNAVPARVARINREAARGRLLEEAVRADHANSSDAAWARARLTVTNQIELLQMQVDELTERLERAGIR